MKAVINRTDGVRLQVDFGKDETALVYLLRVWGGRSVRRIVWKYKRETFTRFIIIQPTSSAALVTVHQLARRAFV